MAKSSQLAQDTSLVVESKLITVTDRREIDCAHESRHK